MPEDNVKILGLNVDNKLNFNTQITNICQTAGRKVQVLSRLSHVLDQSSFIECYFNYCSVIWHFTSNRNTYKIEKIQKKALRYITRDFSSSYSKLLNVCNKNSLYIVRTRKILETVYTIVCEQCPSYLGNLVHVRNDSINLRSKNNLTFPRFKTVKNVLDTRHPFIGIHSQMISNSGITC